MILFGTLLHIRTSFVKVYSTLFEPSTVLGNEMSELSVEGLKPRPAQKENLYSPSNQRTLKSTI